MNKKEYMKEYREKNKEKISKQRKDYRENHKEKIKRYMEGWREKNNDSIKNYNTEYKEKNKDRIREQSKTYNEKYYKRPETIAKRQRYGQLSYVKAKKKGWDKKYYKTHKPKISAINKLYREAHKEESKKYSKEYRKEHYEELKEHSKEFRDMRMREFISTYKKGKCCEMCGYKEYPEILQFHHVKKDKSFSISTFRRKKPELLKKEIDKCLLLCSNCHFWLHYILREIRPTAPNLN